jgi:alkylation response protein AidB-like acyl-CoA dehydrogenase
MASAEIPQLDAPRSRGSMNFELEPVSGPGAVLAEVAEKHADEFALTAEEHDRFQSFPYHHWAAMRRSGLFAASVPTRLGGLGVSSIHDLVVAVNRLARGDASIAIGAAMHLTAIWYFSRLATDGAAAAVPVRDPASLLGLLLRRCARGHVVACVAASEPGTSLGWPRTTARLEGDRYRLDGRKTFCTGSPAGTVFLSTVRVVHEDSPASFGLAVVPRDTPGLSVLHNWDAMGMRASGSHDVVFDGCQVPRRLVTVSGPLGVMAAEMLPLTMVGTLLLIGAALGIAERAQELATPIGAPYPTVPDRFGTDRPSVRRLVAENEVDLMVARAAIERTATIIDGHLAEGWLQLERPQLHELMKEIQCVNVAAKRAAITVVDRALTICGGRGYLGSHPLSRLYRDVRAGPFMQPLSMLEVFDYIGAIALGLPTELDPAPDGGSHAPATTAVHL